MNIEHRSLSLHSFVSAGSPERDPAFRIVIQWTAAHTAQGPLRETLRGQSIPLHHSMFDLRYLSLLVAASHSVKLGFRYFIKIRGNAKSACRGFLIRNAYQRIISN